MSESGTLARKRWIRAGARGKKVDFIVKKCKFQEGEEWQKKLPELGESMSEWVDAKTL